MTAFLDKSTARLRELLAPSHCILCLASPVAADTALCESCRRELPWNLPACPRCARPGPANAPCGACQQKLPPWDAAWAAFHHTAPVREAVLALKYHAGFPQARWLATEMALRLSRRAAPLPQRLLPVPLHRSRLRHRGYNQALELARQLGTFLDIPVDATAARRLRATPDQIGRDAAARRRNVRGAFAVSSRVAGQRVALVDDVITTGSTLAELARACGKAGVTSVEIWAAARAE